MKVVKKARKPTTLRSDVLVTSFSFEGKRHAVLSFPVAPPKLAAELTPSQHHVTELVLAGRSNAEIAAARGTSARTVANQLAAIYRRLGISSRRELIAWCIPRRC